MRSTYSSGKGKMIRHSIDSDSDDNDNGGENSGIPSHVLLEIVELDTLLRLQPSTDCLGIALIGQLEYAMVLATFVEEDRRYHHRCHHPK